MADWNWNSDDAQGDVVVPQVQAVAIYTNGSGEIVIRQHGYDGFDDSLVIFPKSYAKTIVDAILEEI